MNSIKYSALVLILALLASGCRKQPGEIILRSAIKMDTLKEVTYENRIYRARDNQNSSNRPDTATAICYFDFDPDIPLMNARYYFNSNSTEYFYDGEKSVHIHHDLNHIVTDASPNKFTLLRSYFITYSLHSMKNLLPALIDNPNAEIIRAVDTTMNERKCYNLEIRLKGRWVDMLDGKLMEADNQNPFYRLLIDKKSRFPVQFTYYNDKNKIVRQSIYDGIKTGMKPESLLWEKQNPNDSYIEFSADEFQTRLVNSSKTSVQSNAPFFELSTLDGDVFRLQSSGKPVLLVFWYPECDECEDFSSQIAAMTNQNPSVRIIWIDMKNSERSVIRNIVVRQNREFTFLLNGNSVSEQYGVISAPTYFIIDKEGKIAEKGIYEGGEKPADIGKYLSSGS